MVLSVRKRSGSNMVLSVRKRSGSNMVLSVRKRSDSNNRMLVTQEFSLDVNVLAYVPLSVGAEENPY